MTMRNTMTENGVESLGKTGGVYLIPLTALVLCVSLCGGGTARAVSPDDAGEKGEGREEIFAGLADAGGRRSLRDLGSACGTHTWVSPDGGSVKVNLTKGAGTKRVSTPLARLDFGGGRIAHAFCTDISHNAGGNRTYCLDTDFFSDWRVTWLVTNYPPESGDRVLQAARQCAVWHFTDGWDLDAADPSTGDASVDAEVLAAYNGILAAIPGSPPAEYAAGNVQIVIDPASETNFLPGQEEHPFTVRLTKGGEPLAGYTVGVSTDTGALDRTVAVTDAGGEAGFTLTHNSAATASIAASATVSLPAGSRFIDRDDPQGKQRLVLGEEQETEVPAGATKTWQDADNLVIAHKFEDGDFNGVQDSGESDLDNWEFTLTLPDSSTLHATTDDSGNAYFYNAVDDEGTYSLTETLKGGWINSTPLTRSKDRAAGDDWTQWIAEFGNARYSIIEVIKFLDSDGDAVWDEDGEPALPGWQFALYDWQGGNWTQLDGGTTGADGRVAFTGLPAGRYRVVENLAGRPGYTNTTPLEREVELGSPEHRVIRFGNRGNLSISGHKYGDADGSVLTANDRAPLPGWTIELWEGERKLAEESTAPGGSYAFENLPPGSYVVKEVMQPEWRALSPADGQQTVLLVDADDAGVDFINVYELRDVPPEPTPTPFVTPFSTPTPVPCILEIGIDVEGSPSSERASPGMKIRIFGCVPPYDDEIVDLYLLVRTPSGDIWSITGGGDVTRGASAYRRGFMNKDLCLCDDLFEHTVCPDPERGTYRVGLITMRAGEAVSLDKALDYRITEIEIVY